MIHKFQDNLGLIMVQNLMSMKMLQDDYDNKKDWRDGILRIDIKGSLWHNIWGDYINILIHVSMVG